MLELRSFKTSPPYRLRFCRLGYCTEHQAAATVDTFLSAEGFTKISKFLRENGKAEPDKHFTSLAWDPLPPDEAAELAPCQDKTRSNDVLPF